MRKELYWELIAQWLDSKGLLEHGSNIYGSWLSELGKKIYEALMLKPESDPG